MCENQRHGPDHMCSRITSVWSHLMWSVTCRDGFVNYFPRQNTRFITILCDLYKITKAKLTDHVRKTIQIFITGFSIQFLKLIKEVFIFRKNVTIVETLSWVLSCKIFSKAYSFGF